MKMNNLSLASKNVLTRHTAYAGKRGNSTQVFVHDPEQCQSSFQQLASGKKRKYVMISGKGGVGKTSLAASLACQLAAGTLLVIHEDDCRESLS